MHSKCWLLVLGVLVSCLLGQSQSALNIQHQYSGMQSGHSSLWHSGNWAFFSSFPFSYITETFTGSGLCFPVALKLVSPLAFQEKGGTVCALMSTCIHTSLVFRIRRFSAICRMHCCFIIRYATNCLLETIFW